MREKPRRSMREEGVFNRPEAMTMRPSPIEPGWIHRGTPVTRSGDHSAARDNFAWTSVWDCTRGTFEWHFDMDETVYILDGRVRVTDAYGSTHTLTAGSIGYFPAHTTWLWEVDHYVRKVAFLRREVPIGLRFATRLFSRLNLGKRVRSRPRDPDAPRFRRSTAALILMSLAL